MTKNGNKLENDRRYAKKIQKNSKKFEKNFKKIKKICSKKTKYVRKY